MSPLSLRVDVPANAPAGVQHLVVHAKGGDASADLPIDITTGQDLPAQLTIKAKLPSLNGTPTTSFEFQFTVTNQSDKDLLVKLAAAAPPGFQTSFMEAYGTQELSSIPIEAGKDKDLKVKVTPPANVTAGDYPVAVQASSEGASADTKMTMSIRRPAEAQAQRRGRPPRCRGRGRQRHADQAHRREHRQRARRQCRASASPPSDWKVVFQPDKIASWRPIRSATCRRC